MPRSFAQSLAAVLLLALPAARAHHSGLYDEQQVIEIAGTITAVAWVNPHVRLTIETDSSAGGAPGDIWRLEGTSVNALERWGIDPAVFAAGEHVVARGPASRFGRSELIAATVELPSGAHVVLWPDIASRLGLAEAIVPGLYPPPEPSASRAATGIFRVWTPRSRTAPDPLPLTRRASDVASLYDPLEDDPALRCEPPGMPVMLDTPYPVEFRQDGDRITMRFEEWDGERTIYMRPGNGPPVQEPTAKGVSFGRWEGSTLAVLTTNVSYPYFDDLGTPQSGGVMILERYTPDDESGRLEWVVTVTDSAMFTEPVVKKGYMSWEPGETIRPYGCTLLE